MSEHKSQSASKYDKELYNRNKGRKPNKKEEDPLTDTSQIKKSTSEFLKRNEKTIMGIAIGIALLVAGYFAYQNFIVAPKEAKSQAAIAAAQQYFSVDSFNLALNGDGQRDGFLKVISKYGNTKAGNLAHYYAGLSYLHLRQFNEAIKHLNKFKSNGTPFEFIAYGALGDAYLEQNNTGKALENYMKAVKHDNNYSTPRYLMRAALVNYNLKKNSEAITLLKRVKVDYPMSLEARDADKYLGLLGETNID